MPETKLKLTKHAKDVIAKREIGESLILSVVKSPDMVFLDRRSSLMVAIKENEQALVVVYNPENDYFEIVTAFKTSKLVKLIRSRLDKKYWVKIR
jgi:hypothetical protein